MQMNSLEPPVEEFFLLHLIAAKFHACAARAEAKYHPQTSDDIRSAGATHLARGQDSYSESIAYLSCPAAVLRCIGQSIDAFVAVLID